MRSNGISNVSPSDSMPTASASAAVRRPVKFLRPPTGSDVRIRASWPANPLRGYLVSDRIAYQLFGFEADPARVAVEYNRAILPDMTYRKYPGG